MTQSTLFQAVPRTGTLTSRLIKQIEEMMTEQHLQPGDKLPPERELAQKFGVSRTVIREAVAALAAKSLLEIVPGGGAVVRSPDADSVSRSLSLFLQTGQATFSYDKVNEVRHLLEVEIAGLAAQRRTEEDLLRMEGVLKEAGANTTDRARFARSDVAFHAALAQSTHNELFCLLLDSIADVLLKVRERGFDVPGTPERALDYHQAILDAVRAGDSAQARHAMQRHLQEAGETQRQAANRAGQAESRS
jgi:GntR family transcriptional repressor for pyruvate dehydrogenase complex